ncbi:S-layer homology domain-containing protein [Peptoniphilus sp. SGI.035]|uniref:S-layer homology domain-containing protein n=1 Tax=Peptoniphilus sp. SGI.035 TaxID=3420564 RepID=UPI003D02ABA7
MKKKLAITCLSFGLVAANVSNVFAYSLPKIADAKNVEEKIELLQKDKYIAGYEDNKLHLDRTLTRAELTKLVVYMLKEEDKAKALNEKENPFKDVKKDFWANGIISLGTELKNNKEVALIAGYPDKTFKPNDKITYSEAMKILVVLKKADLDKKMVESAKWPTSWIDWAREEKILTDEITEKDFNKEIPRKDAFILVYNTLNPKEAKEIKDKQDNKELDIKVVKENIKNYLENLEKDKALEAIDKFAGDDGFSGRIDKKDVALKELNKVMDRANELVKKDTLTKEEEKELRDLLPKLHKKKDVLVGGLADKVKNFVVDWHVIGERTFKASHNKEYPVLKDDKIEIKSKSVTADDKNLNIKINYVTKENYEDKSLDTTTGATPKYKKSTLDKKFYTVEKTKDGFIIKLNKDVEGFDAQFKDIKILKPIVVYTLTTTKEMRDNKEVMAKTVIENGDLVFIEK